MFTGGTGFWPMAMCFVCWFYRESITTGRSFAFLYRGLKQADVGVHQFDAPTLEPSVERHFALGEKRTSQYILGQHILGNLREITNIYLRPIPQHDPSAVWVDKVQQMHHLTIKPMWTSCLTAGFPWDLQTYVWTTTRSHRFGAPRSHRHGNQPLKYIDQWHHRREPANMFHPMIPVVLLWFLLVILLGRKARSRVKTPLVDRFCSGFPQKK